MAEENNSNNNRNENRLLHQQQQQGIDLQPPTPYSPDLMPLDASFFSETDPDDDFRIFSELLAGGFGSQDFNIDAEDGGGGWSGNTFECRQSQRSHGPAVLSAPRTHQSNIPAVYGYPQYGFVMGASSSQSRPPMQQSNMDYSSAPTARFSTGVTAANDTFFDSLTDMEDFLIDDDSVAAGVGGSGNESQQGQQSLRPAASSQSRPQMQQQFNMARFPTGPTAANLPAPVAEISASEPQSFTIPPASMSLDTLFDSLTETEDFMIDDDMVAAGVGGSGNKSKQGQRSQQGPRQAELPVSRPQLLTSPAGLSSSTSGHRQFEFQASAASSQSQPQMQRPFNMARLPRGTTAANLPPPVVDWHELMRSSLDHADNQMPRFQTAGTTAANVAAPAVDRRGSTRSSWDDSQQFTTGTTTAANVHAPVAGVSASKPQPITIPPAVMSLDTFFGSITDTEDFRIDDDNAAAGVGGSGNESQLGQWSQQGPRQAGLPVSRPQLLSSTAGLSSSSRTSGHRQFGFQASAASSQSQPQMQRQFNMALLPRGTTAATVPPPVVDWHGLMRSSLDHVQTGGATAANAPLPVVDWHGLMRSSLHHADNQMPRFQTAGTTAANVAAPAVDRQGSIRSSLDDTQLFRTGTATAANTAAARVEVDWQELMESLSDNTQNEMARFPTGTTTAANVHAPVAEISVSQPQPFIIPPAAMSLDTFFDFITDTEDFRIDDYNDAAGLGGSGNQSQRSQQSPRLAGLPVSRPQLLTSTAGLSSSSNASGHPQYGFQTGAASSQSRPQMQQQFNMARFPRRRTAAKVPLPVVDWHGLMRPSLDHFQTAGATAANVAAPAEDRQGSVTSLLDDTHPYTARTTTAANAAAAPVEVYWQGLLELLPDTAKNAMARLPTRTTTAAPAVGQPGPEADDDFTWRKYGEKKLKGTSYTQNYYRCTYPRCRVRKTVLQSSNGQVREIVYKEQHDHAPPPPPPVSDQPKRPTGKKRRTQEAHGGSSGSNQPDPTDSRARIRADDEPVPMRREPKIVIRVISEGDFHDGYRWRKYGQKNIRGRSHPRSYYRCTAQGCVVRKQVERGPNDPACVTISYEGTHNHAAPPA